MSVDNKKVIDLVSIDNDENVILTITDHLEWDIENEHLLTLQDKINAYLEAIENGELYKRYANAENKNISIRVVSLYPPNEEGKIFLGRVKGIVGTASYNFQFQRQSFTD